MGAKTSTIADTKRKGDIAGLVRSQGHDDSMSRPGLGRQISSKRFKKVGALQWKIFNDLDVHDDKMMLELAVFLQRLMKSTPGGGGGAAASATAAAAGAAPTSPVIALERAATDYFDAHNTEGDERAHHHSVSSGSGINLENITLEDAPPQMGLVRIGSVQVTIGDSENLQDYSLSKEAPTMDTVHEVIDLYRAGGKLSVKSLRRVLRDAYKLLKELPAVMRLDIASPKETVTVVGDLHGQLEDLLHLLDKNGMPSATNKFCFNGDFVDRGPKGLEILVILFLLMTVLPSSVVLNRGNHEDFGLCCVYGFQKEALAKYNEVVFSMFCEMFRHLPVCTVVNGRVLVIHGGLFHREGVTIADLEQIDRLDYVVPSRQYEDEDAMDMEDPRLTDEELRAKDLRMLMHGALWSDPDLEPSLPNPQPNPRGAGVLFGPDQTMGFLSDNGLDMLVRSHECVEDGFDLPFEGEAEGCCATIFSASNYGGSMNMGATMRFSTQELDDSEVAGGERHSDPPLFYTVLNYQLSMRPEGLDGVSAANRNGLTGLVLRKKRQLADIFMQLDREKTGWVTEEKWARTMETVTGLQIAWAQLLPLLADPADYVAAAPGALGGGRVNWQRFISKFHVQLTQSGKDSNRSGALFDAMYANRDRLEAIFRFFDTDGNGAISREEFKKGCELINRELPEGERLENPDAMLDVMDLDGDANVDINEFFEVFRLVDARDGTVDGRITIPGQV